MAPSSIRRVSKPSLYVLFRSGKGVIAIVQIPCHSYISAETAIDVAVA